MHAKELWECLKNLASNSDFVCDCPYQHASDIISQKQVSMCSSQERSEQGQHKLSQTFLGKLNIKVNVWYFPCVVAEQGFKFKPGYHLLIYCKLFLGK